MCADFSEWTQYCIMKNLMAILSILIMVFIFNSCGKEEAIPEQLEQETLIDLTGEWLGKDYECPFVDLFNIEERVRIVHNLKTGMVVATKITGDPCVPAGDITFHGYYSGTTSTFAAIFMAGSPTRPSSGGNNMTIDVYTSVQSSA